MKTILLSLTTAGLAFVATSCVSHSPQSRIAQNPAIYDSLPTKHQALASQGKIAKGMHKIGVFIAWGNPHHSHKGFRNGKHYERWVYTASYPNYRNNIYGNYGWGRRHGYYGVGMLPTVSYQQKRIATVTLRDDHVTEWERRR